MLKKLGEEGEFRIIVSEQGGGHRPAKNERDCKKLSGKGVSRSSIERLKTWEMLS